MSSTAALSQSATLTISPATYTGAGVTMTYSIRITPGSYNIRSINPTSSNVKGVSISCDAIPPNGFVIPFNCTGTYVTNAMDVASGQFGDNVRFTGTRTGGSFDFTSNYATATKQGGGGSSTTVSSSPNPALPGQTVLVRARVASLGCDAGQAPNGSVKITVGPQSTTVGLNYTRADRVGDSYADFSTSTLPIGNHAVTAEYLGNSACATSSATGSNQIVNTRPNVTINSAAAQASPTGTSPVNFTVVFERAVTGFATGDVQLSGTAGATTAVVSGSGTTYNVAVSGMTQSGTIVATVPADVASASGLTNVASTSTNNSVDFVVVKVSPTTLPGGTYNTSYAQPLSASGGIAPYAFDLQSGALPAGMSVSGGQITGTPTQSGTFNVVVRATDANAITGTQAMALTIAPPTIVVTPPTLPSATVGVAYPSQTLAGSGAIGPYRFTRTGGALPSGLTLDEQSGVISGTPTAGGTFSFTVTATEANNQTGSRLYTMTVNAPTIALPATSLANGVVNAAYSATINPATGGTAPYSYFVSGGALPTGMTLSSSGQISGSTSTPGPYNFTVTARDSSTGTGPYTGARSYTLTITNVAPVANPASATIAYDSAPVLIALNIGGGAATSVAVATPPAHGTATPSGTSMSYQPASGYAGTDSFTYTASNDAGPSAPATITVTIVSPTLAVAPASPLSAQAGKPFQQTFMFSGGASPYTQIAVTGLPAGVQVTGTTANSVTVSGTPTATGSFSIVVSAVDASTGTGPFTVSSTVTLTVAAPALALTPAANTIALQYGQSFSQAFAASGGSGGYSYAISGTLPAGLTFAGDRLSGIPTQPGSFPITVTATDSTTGAGAPFTISNQYTLSVAAPTLGIAPGQVSDATAGVSYSASFSADGGVGPYEFTLDSGSLPEGLSLANGVITGMPIESGSFAFSLKATDKYGQSVSAGYTLVVRVPTLAVAPASLPQGIAGSAYGQAFSATGGVAPYSYDLSGSLPAGLDFDAASGQLHGTPTQSGSFPLSIRATDRTKGTAATASQAYTLSVAAPEVAISPATLPGGVQRVSYSKAIVATGGIAPYVFEVSGSLPAGITLDSATGVLSGTPEEAGTFTISVTATDSTTGTAGSKTVSYALVIADGVPVVSADTAHTLGGKPVDIDVTQNDVGSISSVMISSPPANGTTSISGSVITYTPATTFSGTDSFEYVANGPGGTSSPALVTITVDPLPIAQLQAVSAVAGQPVTVDLASSAAGGPFNAANLVSVTPQGSGTAVLNGFNLTYTPDPTSSGPVTIAFTLSNDYATSAPASITIAVQPRIDPTTDPEVMGVLAAQTQATQRFATSQVSNFQQRLEGLHDDDDTQPLGDGIAFIQGIMLGYDTVCQPMEPDCGSQAKPDLAGPFKTALGDAAASPVNGRRPRLTVWTGGSITIGKRDGDASYDFTTTGLSAGMDYRLTHDLTVGIGAGYGHDDSDIGDNGSRSKGESYTAAIYASYHPGDVFFVDGLAGHQWLNFDSLRYVSQNGNFVSGNRDGEQWLASISTGARLQFDQWRVTPYGRLDVAKATLGSYTESGDPIYALHYGEQDISSTTGNIGVTLDYKYLMDFGSVTPKLRLEYQHDFASSSAVTLNYADVFAGPSYTASADGMARDRFQLGLGLDIQTTQDLSLRMEYRGLFDGKSNADHSLAVSAGARF